MNLRRNSCGANYWLVRFETQPYALSSYTITPFSTCIVQEQKIIRGKVTIVTLAQLLHSGHANDSPTYCSCDQTVSSLRNPSCPVRLRGEVGGEGLCLAASPQPTHMTVLSLTGQHLLCNKGVAPCLLTALISGDINVHLISFHGPCQ